MHYLTILKIITLPSRTKKTKLWQQNVSLQNVLVHMRSCAENADQCKYEDSWTDHTPKFYTGFNHVMWKGSISVFLFIWLLSNRRLYYITQKCLVWNDQRRHFAWIICPERECLDIHLQTEYIYWSLQGFLLIYFCSTCTWLYRRNIRDSLRNSQIG